MGRRLAHAPSTGRLADRSHRQSFYGWTQGKGSFCQANDGPATQLRTRAIQNLDPHQVFSTWRGGELDLPWKQEPIFGDEESDLQLFLIAKEPERSLSGRALARAR